MSPAFAFWVWWYWPLNDAGDSRASMQALADAANTHCRTTKRVRMARLEMIARAHGAWREGAE